MNYDIEYNIYLYVLNELSFITILQLPKNRFFQLYDCI